MKRIKNDNVDYFREEYVFEGAVYCYAFIAALYVIISYGTIILFSSHSIGELIAIHTWMEIGIPLMGSLYLSFPCTVILYVLLSMAGVFKYE